MTRSKGRSWRQTSNDYHKHNAVPPKPNVEIEKSKYGFLEPRTGGTDEFSPLRGSLTIRSRKVKPSMPKMPWEDGQ